MPTCSEHEWTDTIQDLYICDRCNAIGQGSERDVSYGDYTVAEHTISEVDDWPECDEVVRDIALWAVHAMPTSGIERNLRAILHKALGQIEEFQADAKDEHAEAMKRMGQGIRSFEFCRGQQRFILGALQQMEMECLAAYEAAEDPEEAQEHFDTGDGVGALVIQFQSALEHADLDADTEQKQGEWLAEPIPFRNMDQSDLESIRQELYQEDEGESDATV